MVRQIGTMEEWNSLLKDNPRVVVDFTAVWCGPCKMIGPKFEAMSSQFTNVTFVKVDVDDAADIAELCGVSAMPTFKFFKDGKLAGEVVGASEEKLKALIESNGA